MGDKITITKIQSVSFDLFRIDLYNETQNKTIVTFCSKSKLKNLIEEAEAAEQEGE